MQASLLKRLLTVTLVIASVISCSVVYAQRMAVAGLSTTGDPGTRSWVDVNGDGRDDFCALGGADRNTIICYLSDGFQLATVPVTFIVSTQGSYRYDWADINGDGKVDLCRFLTDVNSGWRNTHETIECRLGPNFQTVVNASIPLFAAVCDPPLPGGGALQAPATTKSGPRAAKTGGPSTTSNPCPVQRSGLDRQDFVFYLDFDLDGRTDICYLSTSNGTPWSNIYSYRCLRSTGTSFVDHAASALDNVYVPEDQLFSHADVNGDGYLDFCVATPGQSNLIQCYLRDATGMSASRKQDAPALADGGATAGAAFIDINGDGMADYCRVVGVKLVCRLSTGKAWEAADRFSEAFDAGFSNSRWWADINGDGLPDFCRGVRTDPVDVQDVQTNRFSTMACRLGRAGEDGMFAFGDIYFDGTRYSEKAVVNFGRADGGRAFCDPFGRGIQTFCRATLSRTVGEQVCYEGESTQLCYPTTGESHGLAVGFYGAATNPAAQNATPDSVQAALPLVKSYRDGTGAETRITYLPGTSSQVYARSGEATSFPDVTTGASKAPLVFETRAWRTGLVNPTTLTGTARYFYRDLRSDRVAGSLGFRERWHLQEGTNALEYNIYYQGLGAAIDSGSIARSYLEVGQPRESRLYAIDPSAITLPGANPANLNPRQLYLKSVTEAAVVPGAMVTAAAATGPFRLIRRTVNTIGETSPVNARLRPIIQTTVQSWDLNNRTPVALPTKTISTSLSKVGNVVSINEQTVSGTQTWGRVTTNEYWTGVDQEWLGRLKKSTVASTAPTADTQVNANPRSAGTSPNAGSTQSATGPAIGITAPAFASVSPGQSITAPATISNASGGAVSMTVPTASSVTGASFAFAATSCGTILAGGASCTVTVRFTAPASGSPTGQLSVETASGSRTATLSGTASSVSVATLTGPSAPNLGTVWYGSTAPTVTLSFRNDGNSSMTLAGLSGLTSRFAMTANTCSAAIDVGGTCTMTVSMPTNAAGTAPANVSTVGATTNASFTIAGTVNSAVNSWASTSLAFGTIEIGKTSTKSIVLSNTGFGTAPINWSGALSGLPAGFSANTSGCSSVAPGASCSVSITFSPTLVQAYSGTGIKPSTVSYSANTLSVTGAGGALVPTIAPASWSYGTTTATKSFVVTNTGATAATGFGVSLVIGTRAVNGLNNFAVTARTCPASGGSLAAGATCTIDVRYTAQTPACAGGVQTTETATVTATGTNVTTANSSLIGIYQMEATGCGARVINPTQ